MSKNGTSYSSPRALPGLVGIFLIVAGWGGACLIVPYAFFRINPLELWIFLLTPREGVISVEPSQVLWAISGATAMVSLIVVAWRGGILVAQIKRQILQQIIDTFSRGVEQIGHARSNTVRVAGFNLLRRLISEYPNDLVLCADIIGVVRDYVKERPLEAGKNPESKRDAIEFLKEFDKIRPINLSEAQLENCDLRNMDLEGINFFDANFRGTALEGSNLNKTNLSSVDFREASLVGVDLRKARIQGSNFSNLTFQRINLRGATLIAANLSGTQFLEKNLEGINLAKSNLQKANLSDVNLKGANFEGADLSNANLSRAILLNANLRKTRVSRTNFCEVNLDKMDLSEMLLSESFFGKTSLRKTNLRESNLREARFYLGADKTLLEGANFDSADLTNAWYYNDFSYLRDDWGSNSRMPSRGYPVTKNWLQKHGALNVNSVQGIRFR